MQSEICIYTRLLPKQGEVFVLLNEAVAVLTKVRRLVTADLWIKNRMSRSSDRGRMFCLVGAIEQDILGLPGCPERVAMHELARTIADEVRFHYNALSYFLCRERVISFNDSDDTTKEKVLDVIDRTIARLESSDA